MAGTAQLREEPKRVLQNTEVHDRWTDHFRGPENEPFYNAAFDFIASQIGAPAGEPVVDAGCGTGTKTLHLARRGYPVLGLDISEYVLQELRQMVREQLPSASVETKCVDLTRLPLASASVKRAICWGVLMHIPAVEDAIAELARIVAPGGTLILSEANKSSLQAIALRTAKKLLGRERATVKDTIAGLEFWEQTQSGMFMTRQVDMPWLVREFSKHGLALQSRRAGQFTEIFVLIPWKPLRKLVHMFNAFWFRFVRRPGLAFGNILVFKRHA